MAWRVELEKPAAMTFFFALVIDFLRSAANLKPLFAALSISWCG